VAKDGLCDPGASDTVFREQVAHDAGLDLSAAVIGSSSGAGGAPFAVRFIAVELRVSDGVEFRAWVARVGFTAAPLRWPPLGVAGFLQFFDANFRGAAEVVELTVNATYPGT
jgi:hypothetical protein